MRKSIDYRRSSYDMMLIGSLASWHQARRMRLFKLINTMPTLFESVSQRNKYNKSSAPQPQTGPVVKKKKFEDRPIESKYPSGRLLKADDVSPALKGRQAEVCWVVNSDCVIELDACVRQIAPVVK